MVAGANGGGDVRATMDAKDTQPISEEEMELIGAFLMELLAATHRHSPEEERP